MRYFLIMNPGSDGGKSQKKCNKILATLIKKGINFDHELTNTLEDAYHLSIQANEKGYDVIIAVGGDGTINRVLNGFYDSEGRRNSDAKLAVIHTGTSPDFCKSYGISLEINRALETVLVGNSTKILPGKITYTSLSDGSLATSYFACCANFGLGAAVARIANGGVRNYLGDFLGTFYALLHTLFNYHPNSFTVSLDGQERQLEKVYNISVGKTTYIASGIKVHNDLSSKDTRFYNLIVQDPGWYGWLGVIRKIYSGKSFTNDKSMTLLYAEVIEVCGNPKNAEVEFDGDPRGLLPCMIEAAREPLELICEVHDG
ncbi:MAG: diacylglycerol kinase [Firmicutes bacterium HGW-Firmicutes-12]|jgi:diacylglycerol kinase family enzyme|nr:MAG: diacylglycerol kinase [Firmicutes bacterium HGW-Firmicutes-12]